MEHILAVSLREKFRQNPNLLKYLKDTQGLQLGEASRDPTWAIGMALEDDQVLDMSKWLPSGNLLGRTLTRVRDEFFPPPTTPQTENQTSKQPNGLDKPTSSQVTSAEESGERERKEKESDPNLSEAPINEANPGKARNKTNPKDKKNEKKQSPNGQDRRDTQNSSTEEPSKTSTDNTDNKGKGKDPSEKKTTGRPKGRPPKDKHS